MFPRLTPDGLVGSNDSHLVGPIAAPVVLELLDDADQVRHLGDHAADGGGVLALDDLVEAGKAEALDDELVLDRRADLGTEVLQFDFGVALVSAMLRAPKKLLGRG